MKKLYAYNVWKRRYRQMRDLIRKFHVGYAIPAKRPMPNCLKLTLPHFVFYTIIYNQKASLYLIYVYDCNYSFIFTVEASKVSYIHWYCDTNTLLIQYLANYPFFKLGVSHLRKILHIFYTLFYSKLRIRSRLYRIYKRNVFRDLQYRLGYTHNMYVNTMGLYVKYVRKKQIRLIGYDWELICNKMYEAWNLRPMSIYTHKGIQISKNRYYSRIGKVANW